MRGRTLVVKGDKDHPLQFHRLCTTYRTSREPTFVMPQLHSTSSHPCGVGLQSPPCRLQKMRLKQMSWSLTVSNRDSCSKGLSSDSTPRTLWGLGGAHAKGHLTFKRSFPYRGVSWTWGIIHRGPESQAVDLHVNCGLAEGEISLCSLLCCKKSYLYYKIYI